MNWNLALDELYTVVHDTFAKDAAYSPLSGGGPISVKVILKKEPAGESFGKVGIATAQVRAEVRVSEIAAAAKGDTFVVGADTYKVTRADTDADGLIWQLGVERTS